MTNRIDENQFKLVAELLKRQDDALQQLDLLCDRVEQALEENIESRQPDDPAGTDDVGNAIDQADGDALTTINAIKAA